MADWKYIMFEANGAALPVIFPPSVIHSTMAEGIQHAVRRTVIEQRPQSWSSKPISAGFLSSMIVTGVHGRSESLDNLPSRPEDRELINCWPYNGGMEGMLPGVEAMIFEAVRRSLAD